MKNKVLLTVVCAAIAGSFSNGFCADRNTDLESENGRPSITYRNDTSQLSPNTQRKISELHDIFIEPYIKPVQQLAERVTEAPSPKKTAVTSPQKTISTKKKDRNDTAHVTTPDTASQATARAGSESKKTTTSVKGATKATQKD